MIRKHLLRLGHPVSVAALLEALVAVTNERDDDDRPRPIRLKYLAADGRKLPAWVNSGCGETGLIVSDEPCPEFAEGTLLLWLRLVPVPRRGRVDAAGLYHGQVAVHLWQAPDYPLPRRRSTGLSPTTAAPATTPGGTSRAAGRPSATTPGACRWTPPSCPAPTSCWAGPLPPSPRPIKHCSPGRS